MFELLTGTSPFKANNSDGVSFCSSEGCCPKSEVNERKYSDSIKQYRRKVPTKRPAKRYSTARELTLALDEYTALAERKTRKSRGKIKEEMFYASLASKDARVASELRAFLDDAKSRGLSIYCGDNSLILKFKTHNRIELNFGIFKTNGSFLNRRIAALTERIGYPEIGETYLTVLASLIPGGYVQKSDNKWVWTVRKTGNKPVTIVGLSYCLEE